MYNEKRPQIYYDQLGCSAVESEDSITLHLLIYHVDPVAPSGATPPIFYSLLQYGEKRTGNPSGWDI